MCEKNYNNNVIFCVPKRMLSMALGRNGENLKRIGEIIKIIKSIDKVIEEIILFFILLI